MTHRRALITALVACLLLAPTAGAETCEKKEFPTQFADFFEDQAAIKGWLEKIKNEADEIETRQFMSQMVNLPAQRPSSKQVSAPSSAPGDGTSLVDGADQPGLLALATDSGIVNSDDDGKFTLNLNLFSLRMLKKGGSKLWYLQQEYEKPLNQALRRFSLTVSSGGKGEEFDRDGDGEKDEALEASALDDILTWEVRWRLFGSRDRREKRSWDYALAKLDEAQAAAGKPSFDDVLDSIADDRPNILRQVVTSPAFESARYKQTQCVNLDTLARLIAADTELAKALTPLLGRLVESLGAFKKMHEEVVAWIDKRPLVTLTVGGTEQKGDFGPDKEFVGLRSDWPLRKDQTAKLTVDWNRMDNMMADAEEIETFKAGLEWSTLWNTKLFSKNSQAAEDGIEVSFAATWEKFDNVPDAMHDTQSKVSAKLELPLAKGLTLPLSVTWADHVDLLSDEDEVKGHFGLSYDLSKLFNREEDEEGK